MKLVPQEHGMGCGVASVASILGISYKKALKLFKKQKNASTKGYTGRDICNALQKAGKKYECKYVGKKNKSLISKKKIIVYIKKNKKYKYGHYLAKTSKGWMNSWINLPNKPIKSGYSIKLPGKATYVILPK